jgi:HD-GYP domain-containing protein (c-di-GMP phosphodiesterase class II)
MVLAQTIQRADDGKILLRDHTVLKPYYIQRIKNLNYSFLYVFDSQELEQEYVSLRPIKDETHQKAVQLYQKTMERLKNPKSTEKIDLNKYKEVINEIIDDILSNPQVIYNMSDIQSYDHYTFTHSVNVTVLSILIGASMKFTRNDLEILGIGAMLHDIGKIFISPEILNKAAKLEPGEYEQVKAHTRKGYDLLKTKIQLTFLPAHIGLQHHEREDGTGYPRGITGKSIHRFSKIVAVADVYDAMTSRRVYQCPLASLTVLREIISRVSIKFDPLAIDHLTRVVAPYPKDSVLLLSNGEIVITTGVHRLRYDVQIIEGPRRGTIIDLYQATDLTVIKQLE